MGTSCAIVKANKNGSLSMITVHWDGHRNRAGKTLLDHYTDETKLDQLFKLGNLSVLGENPISKPEWWDYRKEETEEQKAGCLAYRDRGEESLPYEYKDGQQFCDDFPDYINYIYFFKDNKWYEAEKIYYDTRDPINFGAKPYVKLTPLDLLIGSATTDK